MPSLGEDLKKQRERRKISLDEIAQQTKVGLRHLRALETDRFDDLPGGIFNRGILRSYLQCLHLDDQPWMERFQIATGGAPDQPGAEAEAATEQWQRYAQSLTGAPPSPAGEEDVRYRWIGVVLLFAALAAAGWLLWRFASHHWA